VSTFQKYIFTFEHLPLQLLEYNLLANQWSALTKHIITNSKLLSSKILNDTTDYIE